MTLTPLAPRDPKSLRGALVRRGMDESRATAVAQGMQPVAIILESAAQLGPSTLAEMARDAGVECVTGDGWVLLAGSASRLAGMTRAGAERIPEAMVSELGQYLAGGHDAPIAWMTSRGAVDLSGPVLVGILNITPDSFSDGGKFFEPQDALRQADTMIDEGAGMLDLGAESSRPGRPEPVSAEEEWRRLEPVLEELVRRHPSMPISVDTVKSEIARRALESGAWAVNDVSGLRIDSKVASVCAGHGAGLVVMHSRGDFASMASYDHASYEDVVAETTQELTASVEKALDGGVQRDAIVVDPGLGFSKDPIQSFKVIEGLPALTSMGYPVMIGPSRKRFIGAVVGEDMARRDEATAHVCVSAHMLGAVLFRVHAVGVVKRALDVAAAIRGN